MASIIVNFHSGTGSVSGANNRSTSAAEGATLFANLVDTLGVSTGVSLVLTAGDSLNPDASGRTAGADATIQAINKEGAYTLEGPPGHAAFTFSNVVVACDVEVFLCTTYSAQDDLDVSVNGGTSQSMDSSHNTTGAVLTFPAVSPNGSSQLVVVIDNNTPGQFILINGFRLTPLGGGGPTGNPEYYYRQLRAA